MLAVAVDSPVDSQLVRIGLDGAGARWSIAPGQGRFRGPWWMVLDAVALLDMQEVRGSNPLRPTPVAPRILPVAVVLTGRIDRRRGSFASAASSRGQRCAVTSACIHSTSGCMEGEVTKRLAVIDDGPSTGPSWSWAPTRSRSKSALRWASRFAPPIVVSRWTRPHSCTSRPQSRISLTTTS